MTTIAARLIELRKAKGMTQQEAADAAGLSRNYISMLEIGERRPSIDAIAKLAEVYGGDAGELGRILAHEVAA